MTTEALRELDAKIAEQVMGWAWMEHPEHDKHRFAYFAPPTQLARAGERGWQLAKPETRRIAIERTFIPRYSSDVSSSFLVVEKMHALGLGAEYARHLVHVVLGFAWTEDGGKMFGAAELSYLLAASPAQICEASLKSIESARGET